MISLQRRGCHNLNLVSPTHVVPQILEALELAINAGFSLPLVYNTGGYDSLETLGLLEGIVDIYMPDMKYADKAVARHYSGVKDYPQVNQAAVREMQRQVGDLEIDQQGVARRGLMVRHLVLPNGLAGTDRVVAFLAQHVSRNTYVNIMAQYHPCYRAYDIAELARPVSEADLAEAVRLAREQGLERLDRLDDRLAIRFI